MSWGPRTWCCPGKAPLAAALTEIAALPSLLQAFQHGNLGLLHFSCHAFADGAPNASRILLGDQPFEPVLLEQYAGRYAPRWCS